MRDRIDEAPLRAEDAGRVPEATATSRGRRVSRATGSAARPSSRAARAPTGPRAGPRTSPG